MFTESLTIRILGDSSQLQSELENASRLLQGFSSRLEQFEAAAGRIGRGLSGLGQSSRQLFELTNQLASARQAAEALSNTVITLNVAPALAALRSLATAAMQTGSVLTGLSAARTGGAFATNATSAVGTSSGTSRAGIGFASGGLVSHGQMPASTDTIPAWLSPGEFVLREPAVRSLGLANVATLNTTGEWPQRHMGSVPTSRFDSDQHRLATHFGDIHISVHQTADMPGLLRDLEWSGARLATRRG